MSTIPPDLQLRLFMGHNNRALTVAYDMFGVRRFCQVGIASSGSARKPSSRLLHINMDSTTMDRGGRNFARKLFISVGPTN